MNKNKSLLNIVRQSYIHQIILGCCLIITCVVLSNNVPSLLSQHLGVSLSLDGVCYIVSSLILAVLILYPLYNIICQPSIKKLQESMDALGISDYEAYCEYKTAEKHGVMSLSNNFTFIKRVLNIKVIPNNEIIWVYVTALTKMVHYTNHSGANKERISKRIRYSLVIKTKSRKEYNIPFYKVESITAFLEEFNRHSYILVGYDDEYDKLYKYYFNDFLDLKYNPNLPDVSQKY